MRIFRKRQQIANVTAVSVRNDTVSSVEPLQLASIASHLLEIDLQDNLLWRWEEVGTTSLYCCNVVPSLLPCPL